MKLKRIVPFVMFVAMFATNSIAIGSLNAEMVGASFNGCKSLETAACDCDAPAIECEDDCGFQLTQAVGSELLIPHFGDSRSLPGELSSFPSITGPPEPRPPRTL